MPDLSPADAVVQPGSPGRVLVVDDDEANRESLTRRLQRRGYVVTSAGDGTQALAAVDATEFDVVLLDVMMPGISGLDVLSSIRRTRPASELPVIMATARDGSEDVVEALGRGANDYVTKPLDFAAVLARVRTHVELARSVREVLRLERQLAARNAELEAANDGLRRAAEQARRDLELAAKVQATFLPKEPPFADRLRVAWRYLPCQELAGDALNVCRLDDDHVGFYVLDVSGHGVAASLTAVAAARLLNAGNDSDSILMQSVLGGPSRVAAPADVLQQLAVRFPWDPETTQFLTLFYGVLHLPTGKLTYSSAGHPSPVLLAATGNISTLESTGVPIGVLVEDCEDCYEQRETHLAPGDRLYVYSDGVTEAMSPDGELFGTERLIPVLADASHLELSGSASRLLEEVAKWRGAHAAKDDVSVIALERR